MGRSIGRESLWGGKAMWGVTHWGENAMWRVLGIGVVWRVEAMAMGGGVTMMMVVGGTMEA